MQTSELISKVSVAYSHTHLLMYCLCLLSCYRDGMAQKAENIYHVGLYSESLLTPGLDTELIWSTYDVPGTKAGERKGNQWETFLLKNLRSSIFRST